MWNLGYSPSKPGILMREKQINEETILKIADVISKIEY